MHHGHLDIYVEQNNLFSTESSKMGFSSTPAGRMGGRIKEGESGFYFTLQNPQRAACIR